MPAACATLAVMGVMTSWINRIVAASIATVAFSLPAAAEGDRLQALYDALAQSGPGEAAGIVRDIRMEWSKTGSPSIDLLLRRGRDALERGEVRAAIEHLTAATDHAPGIAQGWALRARAFFEAERPGIAAADLERALALDPRHFQAAFGLAAIFEQLDRPEAAARAYALVLRLHPHYDRAREALERLDARGDDVAL